MSSEVAQKIPLRLGYFGGRLLKKSHAKKARPLSTKRPVHIVFRSTTDLLLEQKNQKLVRFLLRTQAKHFKVELLGSKNLGNHLHVLVRAKQKNGIRNFLRTISALLARYIQGVHKGSSAKAKFWDQRPFTRIIEGYGLRVAMDVAIQKQLEALGVIPYASKTFYFNTT